VTAISGHFGEVSSLAKNTAKNIACGKIFRLFSATPEYAGNLALIRRISENLNHGVHKFSQGKPLLPCVPRGWIFGSVISADWESRAYPLLIVK
jgi:hypothetical protein